MGDSNNDAQVANILSKITQLGTTANTTVQQQNSNNQRLTAMLRGLNASLTRIVQKVGEMGTGAQRDLTTLKQKFQQLQQGVLNLPVGQLENDINNIQQNLSTTGIEDELRQIQTTISQLESAVGGPGNPGPSNPGNPGASKSDASSETKMAGGYLYSPKANYSRIMRSKEKKKASLHRRNTRKNHRKGKKQKRHLNKRTQRKGRKGRKGRK